MLRMKDNEHVNRVLQELDAYDITPKLDVNSKHVKIIWQAPGRPRRTAVTSKTPSDHRTFLNLRAQVRRVLRGDQTPLKTREQRQLQHAFAPPALSEPLAARLTRIEEEVAALADLVFEQFTTRAPAPAMNGHPVLTPVANKPTKPVRARSVLTPTRQAILDLLSHDELTHYHTVAAKLGKSRGCITVHLNDLKKLGLVRPTGQRTGHWFKAHTV